MNIERLYVLLFLTCLSTSCVLSYPLSMLSRNAVTCMPPAPGRKKRNKQIQKMQRSSAPSHAFLHVKQRNPVSSNPGKFQLEVHHFKMTNVLAASDATVNLWLQINHFV